MAHTTIADLTYHVPPICQGQIVEIAYAGAGDRGIVRRTHDRSDKATTYEIGDWLDGEEFEPWNGESAVRADWRAISGGATVRE